MPRISLPLLCVGLMAGASIAIQAGVNARLRQALATPFQAAFVSFLVGTLALGVLILSVTSTWPPNPFSVVPWWAWTGGLLGAFYISTAILLAPRVGALGLAALIITGQLLAALVLDHFGLLAFPRISLSASRVVGAGFLLLGVVLILRRGR